MSQKNHNINHASSESTRELGASATNAANATVAVAEQSVSPVPTSQVEHSSSRKSNQASFTETETIYLKDDAIISVKNLSRERRISDIERRLDRLERKVNSNERFARTFARCLNTQRTAADAVLLVLRKSLHEDAEIRDELTAAIKEYDRHRISRWFSGFFGAILRIVALAAAAFMGAFIYWVFSGK